MIDNIVVGAVPEVTATNKLRYLLPLSFGEGTQQSDVTLSIANSTFIIFFNINSLSEDNLYLSSYSINKTTIYFAGYKCVFGNYINIIDNGCPYLFYFLDKSNGQNYQKTNQPITYSAINNGVSLYAELR